MKICFSIKPKTSANVLVLTLILTMILGTTLGSYLLLVRTQTVLGTQSQAWNSALTLAEAGIEEGMAQINIGYGFVVNPTNFQDSISTNWGALSGGVYSKSNTLLTGSYFTSVFPTNPG